MTILTKEIPNDEVMTLPEVARMLKMSPSYVYRLARRGEIPHFKVGAAPRVWKSQLMTWLDARVVAVEQQ